MKNQKVFINGKIHTLESSAQIVESFSVENGKFAWVGSNADGKALAAQGGEVCDLAGASVYPSFIEAHMHFRLIADGHLGLNLSACDTLESYKEALRRHLAENPDETCLKGFGWHDRSFGKDGPVKKDLDEISCDIPIVLMSDSGHCLWLNSKALAMSGIDKHTQELGKGVIARDVDGEPTGLIKEDCMYLVRTAIPDFTVKQYKEVFQNFLNSATELGISGFFDAWLDPGTNSVAALRELAKEGAVNGYIRGAYALYSFLPLEEQISAFCEDRTKNDLGEIFQMGAVKFFLDGVTESRTAYLLSPYADNDASDPDYTGINNWEQAELNEAMARTLEYGFQVHIHCIGDAATHQAVLALEYAKKKGFPGKRNVFIHLELVHEQDFVKFKSLDVVPLLNPYWAEIDDFYFEKRDFLGEERVNKMWPINRFIQEGLICGMGSDYPITEPNPFVGIELGVTRTASKYYHPWISDYENGKCNFPLGSPEEKASVLDMLKMSAIGSAYSLFMEDFSGSIAPGKNADFIVANQDIFNIAPSEISNTKVNSMYFKGNLVFQRK